LPVGNRQFAIDAFNQAAHALNQHDNPARQQNAYQMFASACHADTEWWQSFYQAGNNNSDLDHLHAAIACWRRALQCDLPDVEKAKTLANLGWRLHCLGKTEEAFTVLEESIKLNPNDALPWVNLSCVHQVMGYAEDEHRCAELAYSLEPTNPIVETSYAFGCLFSRRLAKGFKHFEARFPYKLKSYLTFPYPKWEGQNGTVFLDADQGLGDTLSFARFIPIAAARAKYIHACVQPELLRLFTHAFVGLPNVNIVPKPCGFLPADYWSTFVSLPFALGLTDEEIRTTPQIEAPTIRMPINWKLPDRKLHVGISWAGSAMNDINKHRSIPITQFLDLYRVPGVQLYSLQRDENRQQMYDVGGMPLIVDLSRYVSDVVDTLAMVQDLDMIITIESALGHIAGVLNKETWIPYSRLGKDYRLGVSGEDPFWYPNHRMFNQGADLNWQPVFDQICIALEEKISGAS
jgi:hypothetical protein